ncbi:GAF domain-containing protein [Balneolaceae bacterium YR4-1]|uniref:histidine kinase n=1 Tax=Halalkalibaculum roseum TaxID=2709311 RepID=A0A6M1SUE3_9BACT|nr:GAF domain-containing sensor histidine kinase [Halalkalibaculum roseum]NGP75748.1 GAF domain-containing protein [Halalkalibaculum roseum]
MNTTNTNRNRDTLKELMGMLEQRDAELTIISNVQQGLAENMELQEIYEMVGEEIRDLFDAQVTAIATFDNEYKTETFRYLYENGERVHPDPRPIDKVRQRLIDSRELLYIAENAEKAYKEITGEEAKAVPGTKFPKSVVVVPLILGDTVRGYVSLQNLDREHAFSDDDIRLLSTLANSLSVALENARLFNETEQRNAELAVINSVQQGLVAEMDMQGIYELVGERIRTLFDAQVAVISTFDHENHKEEFQYGFEDGERIYPEPREIDKVRQRLIDSQTLICINEDADEVWKTITGEEPTVVPGTKLTKSALYVPMVVGNKVRGYVSLQNLDREHAFSESDVRLLSTLTNSMSVALENARLFNETEQRNAELAVINSVQQGLVAEMDMQGIYDLVGDRIRQLFDAQVAAIATFDHEYETETFRYLFENGGRLYPKPRKYDKIRQRLIKTNNMINIQENAGEAYTTITGAPPTAVPGTGFPKSMVFVPLSIGDTVRGYVSLQNLDKEHAFSESDVRLLRTLANSMSVALENARLFNETEQRNAELAVINSVQEGLVAEMDMQGIYELVGERIRNLFDAQVTGIVTFNHEDKTENFKYLFEDGDRLYPSNRPYDKVREKIINDRSMLLLNENAAAELSAILGQPHKPVPGTRVAKSALYVPMLVGDKVRGYVTLQNLDREHAFSESDVRLLNTLVNSMSVALENARLFNETTRLLAETEQRNAELAVINSVQEGLVREMDMEAIYSLVGDRICNVLNTQTLVIRTFDHKKEIEHWEYVIENGERFFNEPRPFIWANKYLIEHKEHLLINRDYIETAKKYGDTEQGVSKGLPPKSAIFVPMIVGDEVIGSVSLQNVEQEDAFDESDVRLLTTLTNSMSVALENARLFNETNRLLAETEQRASELQTVNNISRALVSQLEFDALIDLVGEQMRETFKADIVYLALYEREENMLHFPYYYGDKNAKKSKPFGNGLTEKIITTKKPLLINHDLEEAYDRIKAEKIGKWVESYLGVPIVTGDKAIGVISVQSTEEKNRFTEYDQRLLSTIAANVGVAMQNAEAYENLQEALTELKAAQEQLVQQEKLASLGQLTAGIAHEIKNPLNFVNNFSDVSIELVQEIRDEVSGLDASDITEEVGFILDDVEANLKKILEHGRRADGIVKSMLLHSRGKSGERIPTDLNKLIDEYVKLAYHGMRAVNKSFNIDIQTDYDDSIGIIDLVAQDLSRAFLNIINNAMYAAYEHCSTTKERNPIIKITTQDLGGRLQIGIRDNGPGIPDEIREKIFEPFFTTKPTGEGTGLGLSMTYDIINLHNGTLRIESDPGSYTEFVISLPKTPARESRNAVG